MQCKMDNLMQSVLKILHLIVNSFFVCLDNEKREWIMVVIYEETKFCYNKHVNFTLTLFILHLIVYSLFMCLDNERRQWMIVDVYEKRETIKKIKKKFIF